MTTTPNMLAWALRYADHGFHVIPCHEPVFNDPHGYLCTCEAWRHTGECKRRDEERRAKGQQPLYLEPHQHCANPGKHPRGLEHGLKQASNDPAIIRHWWRKYPNANIAHVPGMAGMVMLDGDTYKAEYAGDEMALTPDELHTLTVRSGKGGTHLYYRKHEGATYTNAAGTLPPGVDVRGDSGYALLPPSINSGGRYSWEDGHNPGDLAPQLLPQRIHDILITASAKTARTSARFSSPARWDGTPSTEAPDLATWKLSLRVRHLIAHPAAKGERSEADAKVVQALSPDELFRAFYLQRRGIEASEETMKAFHDLLVEELAEAADDLERLRPDGARRAEQGDSNHATHTAKKPEHAALVRFSTGSGSMPVRPCRRIRSQLSAECPVGGRTRRSRWGCERGVLRACRR